MNDEAFLIRARSRNSIDVSECKKIYQILDLSEVDLSFAGRLSADNTSLAALSRLNAGDPLLLKQNGDRWEIADRNGITVGRLAKKFSPPASAQFREGSVYAISTRVRQDSAEEYHAQLKREEWNVVLPELVFRA